MIEKQKHRQPRTNPVNNQLKKPPHRALRDLALHIEKLCREHPCYSQAWPHVSSLVDHLCAIAAIEELNRRLAQADAATSGPATA